MGSSCVLVAYASSNGATAEIAGMIGSELRAAGAEAVVLPVASVASLDSYTAFVVGSAVYMGVWRRAALDFLTSNATRLRTRPLWLFSSGPVDGHPGTAELMAPAEIVRLAALLGAREHVVFAGRLAPEQVATFRESMGALVDAGDYRDFDEIKSWARAIAARLDETGS